jgi:hypothetical protein
MAFMGAVLHGLGKAVRAAGKKAGKAAPGGGGTQDGSQAGSASTGQKLKQNYKNWIASGQQSRPKQQLDLSPKFAPRSVPSMKHGGRVKKTGLHLLHKGEHVIPAAKRSAKSGSHKRVLVKL